MPKLDETLPGTGRCSIPLSRPTPEASYHSARPPCSHCMQPQILARAAVEAGIEQSAGLGLAGGGAAMLEDDVEAVVGAEAADPGLAGDAPGYRTRPPWPERRRRGPSDRGWSRRSPGSGAACRRPRSGFGSRASLPPARLTDSLRSKRARSDKASSGRATVRSARRPRVMSIAVPALIWSSGTAPATSAATCSASCWATPARSSARTKPSPSPSVAISSTVGRSGVSSRGSTASVGAIRRPVSAPRASGEMASARASSNWASESGAGRGGRGSDRSPGASHQAAQHKSGAGEGAAEPGARADARRRDRRRDRSRAATARAGWLPKLRGRRRRRRIASAGPAPPPAPGLIWLNWYKAEKAPATRETPPGRGSRSGGEDCGETGLKSSKAARSAHGLRRSVLWEPLRR